MLKVTVVLAGAEIRDMLKEQEALNADGEAAGEGGGGGAERPYEVLKLDQTAGQVRAMFTPLLTRAPSLHQPPRSRRPPGSL